MAGSEQERSDKQKIYDRVGVAIMSIDRGAERILLGRGYLTNNQDPNAKKDAEHWTYHYKDPSDNSMKSRTFYSPEAITEWLYKNREELGLFEQRSDNQKNNTVSTMASRLRNSLVGSVVERNSSRGELDKSDGVTEKSPTMEA
jgi:hypothetical protein